MLKRCPCCGNRAMIDFAHGSNQYYVSREGKKASTPLLHRVACTECFLQTQPYEDVNMAIEAWNRRIASDNS